MGRTLKDKIEKKTWSEKNEQISLGWAKDMYLCTLLFSSYVIILKEKQHFKKIAGVSYILCVLNIIGNTKARLKN